MLLTDTISTEHTWCHINRECLVLFLISRVLHNDQLVVDSLSEVKLAAEDGWENALRLFMLQDVLALVVFGDFKEEDETTDLLLLVLETATSENGDRAILLDNTCL